MTWSSPQLVVLLLQLLVWPIVTVIIAVLISRTWLQLSASEAKQSRPLAEATAPATPTDEARLMSGLGKPDYSTLVRLAEHGQQNKWQTFHMFLLFQSLLFLSWTNLYAKINQPPMTLLLALPGLGILTGAIWCLLGADYAKASKLYSDRVVAFEKDHFSEDFQILKKRDGQIEDKLKKWWGFFATSGFVTTKLPAVIAFLWFLLASFVFLNMPPRPHA